MDAKLLGRSRNVCIFIGGLVLDYTDVCHGMSMSTERTEVRDRIQKWFLDEGFTIRPGRDQNAFFDFAIEFHDGSRLNVSQRTDKPDQVVIVTRLRLSKEQTNRLMGMNITKRNEILWDLRFGLLSRRVGFSAIDMPLRSLEISSAVYYDGLTKDHFMSECFKVRNALVYIEWTIGRELSERMISGVPL